MKNILILGGSHRDIPLIKASQKLGFFVTTLANAKGYLGHNYADKSYKINFNDLDKVRQIIRDKNIDYLIPGCGEESYIKTVELAQELQIGNFDSLETAKLVHNKWKFKEFCLKHSISTPNGFYHKDGSDLTNLKFPIVVKPTTLSGGRGVDIVNNLEDLKISLTEAKKVSDEIFLEEFIDGELIAYSVYLENQKIVYGFTGKDDTYLNKYLITTAYPIKLKDIALNKLKKDIEKMAKLLSLVDGMFHLQVIIRDDIPYIIDVTRRIPGDFYPNLIEYCDKVEYSQAVIKGYIGQKLNNEFQIKQKQEFIIRHCVMSDKNGTYKDLMIDSEIKDKIIFRFDL
ncbi:MAG: ATP-grasp domain-containing protein, partial [Sulfurovum sp.]|nr:ATP-grasp domain-containing protein [Sulfurovaceae bacterium]